MKNGIEVTALPLLLLLAGGLTASEPGFGERFRDCPECPDMVVVPAGTFLMAPRSRRRVPPMTSARCIGCRCRRLRRGLRGDVCGVGRLRGGWRLRWPQSGRRGLGARSPSGDSCGLGGCAVVCGVAVGPNRASVQAAERVGVGSTRRVGGRRVRSTRVRRYRRIRRTTTGFIPTAAAFGARIGG